MYQVDKVKFPMICKIWEITNILYRCGKDMNQKYGLSHWKNLWLKSFLIVILCLRKNTVFLVSQKENGISIATFQIRKTQEGCYFEKLAVDPQYAGAGVGSFCMSCIEQYAKEMNCNKIYMDVYDKSEHAISFYQRKGYVVEKEKATRKYNELVMGKMLG